MPRDPKKNAANVARHRRRRRAALIKRAGGQCLKCGYSRCLEVLSFHHREPEKKLFKLQADGMWRSWERLCEEADKCDLLCANCHMEVHATWREERRAENSNPSVVSAAAVSSRARHLDG